MFDMASLVTLILYNVISVISFQNVGLLFHNSVHDVTLMIT